MSAAAAITPLTLIQPSVWVPAHFILENPSSTSTTMSAPPVPPRPPTTQPGTAGRPPLPPLPPGFRPDVDAYRESPPRFGDPMLAPRPQKILSSVPADVSTLSLAGSLHLFWKRCGAPGWLEENERQAQHGTSSPAEIQPLSRHRHRSHRSFVCVYPPWRRHASTSYSS